MELRADDPSLPDGDDFFFSEHQQMIAREIAKMRERMLRKTARRMVVVERVLGVFGSVDSVV